MMLPIVLAGLLLVTPSRDTAERRPHPEGPAFAAQSPSASEIRQGLLDLLNVERAARRLPALLPIDELDAPALAHCQDMASQALLSHESSDGKTYVQRLVARGFYFQAAGENVASSETFVSTFIHKAFIGHPGHRANILNPEFDRVGIGVTSAGGRFYYVTQDFLHSLVPQSQNAVREEVRHLIDRILAGKGRPVLEAFPAWDNLADALAQTKADGKARPALAEGLGSVPVSFITTSSVEKVARITL